MDLQPLNGICYAGDTKAITSCGAVALEELSKKPLLDFLTPWGFKPGHVVSRGLHRCRTITLKRIPNQSVYHPFSPTVRVAPTSHGYVEGDKLNSSLVFYKTDFDQGFIHGMIHRYGVPYEPYYGHNNIRKFSYGYRIKKNKFKPFFLFLMLDLTESVLLTVCQTQICSFVLTLTANIFLLLFLLKATTQVSFTDSFPYPQETPTLPTVFAYTFTTLLITP